MPIYLLIGIPVLVVIILWGIMSLPDDDIKPENEEDLSVKTKPKKLPSKKKRK